MPAPTRRARAGIVSTKAIDSDAVRAWTALADRAAEPNPFLRPELVLAAAGARAPEIHLAVVRDAERWLACLPVVRRPGWGRLPLPCLAPWLPEYAYLATPLIDADALDFAIGALVELLARDRISAAVVLDPIDPLGPVGRGLRTAMAAAGHAPVVYADFERADLRRRAQETYLQEAVSGAGRKKLRKQSRVLAEALGAPLTVADRSSEPAAVEAFLDLEAAGWKGEQGTALASRPSDAAFFRAACAGFAASGMLELLALEVDGRTVAMQCNFIDGREGFGFKVAYDPSLERFSPGSVLEVEAIGRFHRATAPDRIDSCAAPDSPLVNRLWPDRRRLQTLLLPTRAPQARLLGPAVRAEHAARTLRRRVRRSAVAARSGGSPS